MQMAYVLVRDHLEQAQAVLDRRTRESQQVHEVLQMVIGLIDELQVLAQCRGANVVRFPVQQMPPRRST
ncbi:MAG: hypothetical protein P4M09_10400 [Devosia sp.]|nr:hypothetical protein [Devosia sp.]